MDWTRLLTIVVTLGVGAWTIGSLVSLVTRFGDGGNGAAVAIVVGILLIALVVAIAVGAKGPRWLANPRHYW